MDDFAGWTATSHRVEAGKLLAKAKATVSVKNETAAVYVAMAQVHATLAQSAPDYTEDD